MSESKERTVVGSVENHSAPMPQITEFTYQGSDLQLDGDLNVIRANKTPQIVWNKWRKIPVVLSYKKDSHDG